MERNQIPLFLQSKFSRDALLHSERSQWPYRSLRRSFCPHDSPSLISSCSPSCSLSPGMLFQSMEAPASGPLHWLFPLSEMLFPSSTPPPPSSPLQVFAQRHLLSQSFSDPLFKIAASLIAALPADSPIFFSSITIFTPLYFPVLSIYVAYWAIYNYHHLSSLRAETVFSPEYSST